MHWCTKSGGLYDLDHPVARAATAACGAEIVCLIGFNEAVQLVYQALTSSKQEGTRVYTKLEIRPLPLKEHLDYQRISLPIAANRPGANFLFHSRISPS